MSDTGSSNDGSRPTFSPDADAALEVALTALRRWADEVGVDAVRVIGPLAGLVAEQRTCALLGLSPAANAIQAGWDATDAEGRTYQIKARAFTGRRGTSLDLRSEHGFDEALLVLYDPVDLSRVEVWRMDRATVMRHANANRDRLLLKADAGQPADRAGDPDYGSGLDYRHSLRSRPTR